MYILPQAFIPQFHHQDAGIWGIALLFRVLFLFICHFLATHFCGITYFGALYNQPYCMAFLFWSRGSHAADCPAYGTTDASLPLGTHGQILTAISNTVLLQFPVARVVIIPSS